VGGIFDTTLFKIEMIYAIILSIITSFLFLGIGILLGSLCNERSIGGATSIIISAQSVLSGMWFPVEGLSSGMVKIMNFLPFKNATILVQNVLNGVNDLFDDLFHPLIIVLTYTLVIFILAIIVFKNRMKCK
jgi:ABC-2 type transport system permease protein